MNLIGGLLIISEAWPTIIMMESMAAGRHGAGEGAGTLIHWADWAAVERHTGAG